jgi:hypothetical protein
MYKLRALDIYGIYAECARGIPVRITVRLGPGVLDLHLGYAAVKEPDAHIFTGGNAKDSSLQP